MMKENTLRELFIDELRDLYDAESRLVKALPKMAKASTSDELRSGIEHHLEQTKEHVERLKEVLSSLDEKATGKKCPGMIGILQEGEEMLDEDYDGSVLDAAIISAAKRVEHYEIAAYGCVHTWAQELGEENAAELLEKTLSEEKETDAKLTELAEQINASANSEAGGKEEGEDEEMDEEERDEEQEERETTTTPRKGKSRSANA
jgi:ferritin-like metal-binding protein YciE